MVGTEKEIVLGEEVMRYTLKRSSRARALRLAVYPGGLFVVTAPTFASESAIGRFLTNHAGWLLKKIAHLRTISPVHMQGTKKDFTSYKPQALQLAHQRLSHFNQYYAQPFGRVTIRNQKTRWGSCSKTGNLSFNYKIALLPPHLADYVVVHELCHLAHFNHSRGFWEMVARTIPYYAQCRAQLRSGKFGASVL